MIFQNGNDNGQVEQKEGFKDKIRSEVIKEVAGVEVKNSEEIYGFLKDLEEKMRCGNNDAEKIFIKIQALIHERCMKIKI